MTQVWYLSGNPGWIGIEITEINPRRNKICLFVDKNMLSRTSSMLATLLEDDDNDWSNTTIPLNIEVDSWKLIPQMIIISEWLLKHAHYSYRTDNKWDLFVTPLKSGKDLKHSLKCTLINNNHCTQKEIQSEHKLIDFLYEITHFNGGPDIEPKDRNTLSDIHTMKIITDLLDLANHLDNEPLKMLFGSYFAMHLIDLPQQSVQQRLGASHFD